MAAAVAAGGGGWPVRLAGLALLLCLAASEDDWSQCRLPCKCKWLSGRKAADCANGSLSVVPSGLSSEIQWLDVSNNRLTILPGEAFRSVGLVNLHKVYMRECDIEELHKDALNGLEILIEIDLSGNKIKTLHPGVFNHNGRLRIIILNRNPIQKVMNRVFSNLTFLQTVEMNDCQIAHIAHEAFVKVGNLQTLRLAGNNLTNMKPDALRRMERLKSLELHNNPWNCDCHLKTFWDWIMAQNLYAQPTACRDPEPLRDRLWSDLTGDSLACKPEVWLHPADGLRVEGGDATLGCRVQGNPEPTVHWVYKSRIIGNHSRRSMNDHPYVVRDGRGQPRWVNLTVVEARFSDDGEYSCVARNPGGMAEAKMRLEVVDVGPRGGGVLGGTISDAWLLILGLVVGMVVLLVIVVVLVCCYCRTKDPRINNNTKKAMGEGVSSNGDLSYHSGPGSEQEKSLITVVNPVQKPPRRYETLSTSTPNELEMKATLLDNGSVITGPSVAECDDALLQQDRSLESLANAGARSRETFDGECLGRGGGGGPGPGAVGVPLGAAGGGGGILPPDLLSFPSRGSQVSPAGSSASTAPDSSRLPPQHGPQSPVRSPLYHPAAGASPHLFGTLPYSRSQSPFSPALAGTPVVLPRQGYVTIPRRPRVPSWSSPPAPVLALDPLTAKLEPVYDNLGPRTTADGSSVLSLNKAGESPAPAAGAGGMRGRPLPPTPTHAHAPGGLPAYYSPIAPIAEQPSPAVARAALPRQRSNPNISSARSPETRLLADDLATPTPLQPPAALTPAAKRNSLASPLSPMNGTPGSRPGSVAGGKVPPKPPPKPKKKPADPMAPAAATGPLYEDEGEDGTEV